MPTRVLLIRHGQSEWNILGRWQGIADIPLSAHGAAQATAAANRLDPSISAVLHSPLTRARETASILANGIGTTYSECAGLIERDCGEWTGLTHQEIDQRWPGDRLAWRPPPGFESDELVLTRLRTAFVEIGRRLPDQTVAAVSHGGVMWVLRHALAGAAAPMKNLAAWWVEVDADELRLGHEVQLLDDPTAVAATQEQG